MPKTSTSMPGISTDPSLRKIFELKYHHPQGQWNVMTRPNILGGSRHDIIMSQAANIPVIPGCFDDVKHSRIDERQTFSKHECTFSSSLHWFEGVSCCMNPVVMPEQGKEKGFMVTCMGHSINIEDAATKTCCRDQRDVCYVVAPLAQGGMEFARKLALNTFYDCLVETQVIVDQQSTGGDFGCPVVFTSSADAVQTSQGVFAGDRATKCMDQMMIMFLGNCFFMCRAMVHLQSMDNFSAKGSYWQVGIEHTYMTYCTLNEAEAALRIRGVASSGGKWLQTIVGQQGNDEVPVADVIKFVRDMSRDKQQGD